MPVLIENRSPTEDILALLHSITDTSINVGAIIDVLSFDGGVTFVPVSAISTGTYAFTIQESDDSGMANANVIDDKNLIGTLGQINKTSFDPPGDFLNVLGLINVKRFIRISGQSSTGDPGVVSVAVRAANNARAVVNV